MTRALRACGRSPVCQCIDRPIELRATAVRDRPLEPVAIAALANEELTPDDLREASA